MSALGRRLCRDADLRPPGLRHGHRADPAARPPLRHGRGHAVGARAAAPPPAGLAARRRDGRRARLRRLRRAGRPLLRARSSASTSGSRRCCSTPIPRSSPSPPSRCAASRPAAASSARSRSPRAASRWCRSAAARARSTRSAPPWRSAARASTRVFILASARVAAETPAVPFAAGVATGAALTFAIAAAFTGGVQASGEGVMWAARDRDLLDRDPDRAVHGRARARRRLQRRDRLDGRARADGRARLDRARRDARPAPARRRRAGALRRGPAAAAASA